MTAKSEKIPTMYYCVESVSQISSGETRCIAALVEERTTQSSEWMHMIVRVEPVSITKTIHMQSYTQRLDGKNVSTFDLLLKRDAGGKWHATFATIEDVILPVELRGFGFASYVFSRLIEWGQHHAPCAVVASLKLAYVDAKTDEDRDRRNRFYSRLGFRILYVSDSEMRAGRCVASSLSQLKTRCSDQISVTSTAKTLARLQQELSQAKTGQFHDRANAENAYREASDREDQLRRLILAFGMVAAASVTISILVVYAWMTS